MAMLLENEFTRRDVPQPIGSGALRPNGGVFETDASVRIELELPGVSSERIRIEAVDTHITVRVDRSVTFIGDEDTLYMIDDRFSGFERSFDVPGSADLCAAHAFFSRDTLTIIVPKRDVRRSIPIEDRSTSG